MRILAISGSLRDASYNTAIARAAVEVAPAGVEVTVYDGLGDVPPYDADLDGLSTPQAVQALRAAIEDADALLFVTPEYNGSIPGVLKNAVDWASRPHRKSALWGKTAAVAGASTGAYGALWAQNDLRRVLGIAGARVVEGDLAVAKANEAIDEHGQIVDESIRRRLQERLDMLVEWTETELIAA
jgi:chromate reductase, NAD(P)H dehydrogenase (quinone)